MKKYLIIILCIGAILRFWNLQNNPAGFFTDEAIIGNDAYALLHTGRDSHNNPPGFFHQSLGDNRGFVQILSTIPFVGIFGLHETSVRLPSAIYGTLTILLIYQLGTILIHPYIGLLSALFLALSPWHIHMSRIGFEFISFPFYVTYALNAFIKGQRKPVYLFYSALLFGIALYTYAPARLLVPLLVGSLVVMFFRRKMTLFILLFIVISLPLLQAIIDGSAFTRFNEISITNVKKTREEIVYHALIAYKNYFTPQFLFTKGDTNFPGQFIWRHSIAGVGELLFIQFPFILLGIYVLLRHRKSSKSQLILLLLFIHPLGNILSLNSNPYATRGILGVIPWQIVSALGIVYAANVVKKRIPALTWLFRNFLIVGTIISFSVFFLRWYSDPQRSSDFWGWQFGPRDIMNVFLQKSSEYSQFVIDGDFNAPYTFISFYDPENRCMNRCFFASIHTFNPSSHQLFAISKDRFTLYQGYLNNIQCDREDVIERFVSRETVQYPNGHEAFFIGTLSSDTIHNK